METICIITTQGIYNGIPGKNLMDFCGKPLLAWSILQAKQAKTVKAVYVASDDVAILGVAESFGATPIKHPNALSADTSTSDATLQYAIDYIEKEMAMKIDIVVCLKATLPLRESRDIDNAVQKLIEEGADSLFSSSLVEDFFIWQETEEGLRRRDYVYERNLRRKDVKPHYLENGSIYLFKPHILRKTNDRLCGHIATYEMDFWKTWEIDSLENSAICEWYFMNRLMKPIVNLTQSGIDLIVYDFDGVMTDNRVLTIQDGTEAVFVNRADGLGVAIIKEHGIPQLILSTESNPVVEARARKIGLPVIYNTGDKRAALELYCRINSFNPSRVVFVGNDLNDKKAMEFSGIPIAPADAHPDIIRIARYMLNAKGGGGVIRELADIILFSSTS